MTDIVYVLALGHKAGRDGLLGDRRTCAAVRTYGKRIKRLRIRRCRRAAKLCADLRRKLRIRLALHAGCAQKLFAASVVPDNVFIDR
ncbi:hypothetical protein SDC9_141872 [bioreactor metagenome]|uniref:Uncharacterized protein n=1 Tax=bioreactor metagenome TaxID=1076179 RepID=A0A645DYX5_9ZZZZ